MSDESPSTGPNPLDNLKHLFAQQEQVADKVVPMRQSARPAPAPAEDDDQERKEKRPKAPRQYIELGEDCPVRPLGVNGSTYYFLDAIDQLVEKHADKLGQNGIDDLFKHSRAQRWADENFGRRGEDGVVNGIDRDLLKRALIAACGDLSEHGVFDPSGRIRGDGGWKDETGRLVMHLGDVVVTYDASGKPHEGRPGIRDQLIYPKGNRQLRPAEEAIAGERGAAAELLASLQTWKWKRGPLDALLSLGWQTLAPVGGAMRWRPSMWTTGDAGTGKSTLLELMASVQGGRAGMIKAASATGAGIWQALKFRSVPVIIDEVEAGNNNEKKAQLIELMKISSSGDLLRRGGGDHQAVEFGVFSPFHFTSINMLPLKPEEISRMALLELQEFAKGTPRPRIDPARLAQIGAALRRRVIQAWPQWDEHLAPWWDPIGKEFTSRTADTFGFLLAMAHLALCDEPAHPDTVAETIEPLIPSLREWQTIAGKDFELMLNHLGTWQLEPYDRGRKITVRQLAFWASSRAPTSAQAPTEGPDAERIGEYINREKAGSGLRANGLAVVTSRSAEDAGAEYLAISFRHSSLSRIFRETTWRDGVWRQSATRTPGATSRKVRIQAGPEGAVLVPIAAVLGELEVGT